MRERTPSEPNSRFGFPEKRPSRGQCLRCVPRAPAAGGACSSSGSGSRSCAWTRISAGARSAAGRSRAAAANALRRLSSARAQVLAEKAKAATHPAKAAAKHAAAKEAAHAKSKDNYGADILQVCSGVRGRAPVSVASRRALPLWLDAVPFRSFRGDCR